MGRVTYYDYAANLMKCADPSSGPQRNLLLASGAIWQGISVITATLKFLLCRYFRRRTRVGINLSEESEPMLLNEHPEGAINLGSVRGGRLEMSFLSTK